MSSLAVLALLAGQPNFEPAKAVPVDAATKQAIAAKTAELKAAVGRLPADMKQDVRADVEVYLKAAEWIARHGEYLAKDTPKQTLAVLDAGMARAAAAMQGKSPWRDVRNKPIARGYYSEVDGSVQPFLVTLPDGFGTQGKEFRLDVVLHGRDATLTEVKFLHRELTAKPAAKPADYVVLEPYGRGNNAYRWAGETDVREATEALEAGSRAFLDPQRRVLRGFSMGGAGTWHLGLHHPFDWTVIGPGAGFTVTRGYIKNLPAKLPFVQEQTLHIYDAADYAENAFNVPVVAYSGEKDPQKAAADNVIAAAQKIPGLPPITHLVAPGLEHKQPPEWQAKLDAEYRKHLASGKPDRRRVRFVTYSTRYMWAGWVQIFGLDKHYERAVIDATWTDEAVVVNTANVRVMRMSRQGRAWPKAIRVDGQALPQPEHTTVFCVKVDGKWRSSSSLQKEREPQKSPFRQGPIDDAFMEPFTVVPPTEKSGFHAANFARFRAEWDKFFRGALPTGPNDVSDNIVLFGDPMSSKDVAAVVAKLPVTWTADQLVVDGVTYDPKTHVLALIYPDPTNRMKYVVLNSGHTFRAKDLTGTNALLYPRLGDWAVLKPTPTKDDPAAAEVVASGLFDEFWQFPKK